MSQPHYYWLATPLYNIGKSEHVWGYVFNGVLGVYLEQGGSTVHILNIDSISCGFRGLRRVVHNLPHLLNIGLHNIDNAVLPEGLLTHPWFKRKPLAHANLAA